jgi:negative regulator of sigma E activity
VSVFVEIASPQPEPRAGLGDHPPQVRADGVMQMGAAAIYVSRVNGYRVTVVGEVPPMTVKSIAEAVQPE